MEIAKIQNGLSEYTFDNILNAEAKTQVARTIEAYTKENGLMLKIQNRNYAQVEAWQYAGSLLGLFPKVINVIDLSNADEIKYRAEVAIMDNAGEVRANGVAVCSNKEKTKRYFEEYAICSMAQTRATGKAFRLLIGWMFKMAGMETTPAEEMEEHDPKQKTVGPTAEAVTKEFKKFALKALEVAQSAAEVEQLVNLAPSLKETDPKFIDAARKRWKDLGNVGA